MTYNARNQKKQMNSNNKKEPKHNKENGSNHYSNKKYAVSEEPSKSYYLIPVFFILCIIPFIVQYCTYNAHMSDYAWFGKDDSRVDLFLFYKQRWFIFLSAITACITIFKVALKRRELPFSKIFIPLSVYAVLVFLSAICSKYRYFSFHGSYELFESVFAILGYCLIVYYIYIFVEKEKDFQKIQYYLVAVAFIMSLLGVFQLIGYDFFATELGKNIVVPSDLRDKVNFTMVFGAKRVYLTMFNPDYVGVYVALVAPIITVLLFFQKKLLPIIFMSITLLGLIACGIGSKSLAGILGLMVAFLLIMLFMWRYLLKRIYITVPAILIIIAGFFVVNSFTDHYFTDKFITGLHMEKTEYLMTDMHTEADGISLTYKGNTMKVQCKVDDNQQLTLEAVDENNQIVANTYAPASAVYTITDERFDGIVLGLDLLNTGQFYIQEEGQSYHFTNMTGDSKYYYVNALNLPDTMITAPSTVFTGYEGLASHRGYIWSRTIPLLKDYILLGSGPDTYTMVFPQNDYMNLTRSGMIGTILTKPHSLYLQIAVETGVASLIAFLVFYLMYFVTSIRLYLRGIYTSFYAKMGVAVFIGTLCYMFTGITNDSSMCTAPIFWTLMGVGITLNYKVAPLIKDEISTAKEAKKIQAKEGKSNA